MPVTRSKLKKSRLSREQFLAGALDVLAEEGESKLRIDRLVGALGVTKGSLYWHFENRADFVRSLARYWEKWSTDTVVEELGHTDLDPHEVLLGIHRIVLRKDLIRCDLVMRSWTTHEPEVAEIVSSVDRTRHGFVREQFRRLGFEGDDLDLRARAYVVAASFWGVIKPDVSRKKRLRQMEGMLALLTAPPVR